MATKKKVVAPPPTPYVPNEYEQGMLDALGIATAVRSELIGGMRKADAGVANGLVAASQHLVDTVIVEIEKRVQRRLGELMKQKRDGEEQAAKAVES